MSLGIITPNKSIACHEGTHMKLDMHIRIPEAPGLINRKKVRGHVYIYYEYDRTYDKEKRITYPKRASIGKLDADGLMVPNANFRK